jgi:hypothetical protein
VSEEDQLRKVGMSKERRVDPQITVGLLVTASGFPLEVAMFEGNKAEKVAAGRRPIARDRFVTVTADTDGKKAEVNWEVINKARFGAGFKGFVTHIGVEALDGSAVMAAYQDLWHVEESFRMSKGDLRARPIFQRKKDSIDAHLTIVFAALAGRPLPPRPHRRLHQAPRPRPATAEDRHHHHRRSTPRPTPPRTRRHRHPRHHPRPDGALKLRLVVELRSDHR